MIVQPYYDGDIVNDIIERMIPMSLNDSFNDFLQFFSLSADGGCMRLMESPLGECKMGGCGLENAEVMERLPQILDGSDEVWRLYHAMLISPTELRLSFAHMSWKDPIWSREYREAFIERRPMKIARKCRYGEEEIICDFGEMKNAAFQLKISASSEKAPYMVISYKLQYSEGGELNVVVKNEWCNDEAIVRRMRWNGERWKCTTQYYRDLTKPELALKEL